jgi:multiple sugar transport system ATP-binding protein
MEARISEVARTLQMEDMLDRRPAQLSGGQRQRVAIGRALVREPQVFLFDEPLSNLDAMLRMQMRVEIAKLHQDLKTTMIYVTHDQVEAMTLADKIVVLDRGVISQVGTPMELYNAPANKFVASFIGSPTMNFVGAQARPDAGRQIVVTLPAGKELRLTPRGAGLSSGQAVELGIRPEHVRLGASGDSAAALSGTVRILERLGNATIVYVDTPAGMIVVHDGGDVAAKIGDSVGIIFDPERVHLFASGKAI